MSWIHVRDRFPAADGIYWCYCKLSKRKKWGKYQLEFKNQEKIFLYEGRLIRLSRIRAFSLEKECPEDIPQQNLPPSTNEEIFFKRMEMVGDAVIPCILTHYYIDNGYRRAVIHTLVGKSISNRMLGIAGMNAGLKAPAGIVVTKYYGSAFEFQVGKILVDEGYPAAYNYVRKWLIPVIAENIDINSISTSNRSLKLNPLEINPQT